jgi:hypothetical protein
MKNEERLVEKLRYFLGANEFAIRLCVDLIYIAHLWDDLIDKDVVRSDQEINDAFRIALVDIPQNPFYQIHQKTITPILLNIILRWQDSNVLEKGEVHDKHLAYGHRAGISEIIGVCAYLVGGPSWAGQQGPDIRRMYEEKLEDFMEEMNNA